MNDDLPLRLPTLTINDTVIKRVNSIKFLGVMIQENMKWDDHIKMVEFKISKNLGIMKKSKCFVHSKGLKNIYFALIHSYINYCNIAWGSKYHSHLKKIFNIQKHATRRAVLSIDKKQVHVYL